MSSTNRSGGKRDFLQPQSCTRIDTNSLVGYTNVETFKFNEIQSCSIQPHQTYFQAQFTASPEGIYSRRLQRKWRQHNTSHKVWISNLFNFNFIHLSLFPLCIHSCIFVVLCMRCPLRLNSVLYLQGCGNSIRDEHILFPSKWRQPSYPTIKWNGITEGKKQKYGRRAERNAREIFRGKPQICRSRRWKATTSNDGA